MSELPDLSMTALPLTAFDYLVLIILLCSVLISVLRGLVKEAVSLASWALSLVAANVLGGQLAPLLPEVIPGELVRLFLSFVVVFIVAMLVCSLIGKAIAQLVKSAGLSFADRGLGAVFGMLRGLCIIWTLAILAGMTALPQQPVWREALFSPYVEGSLRWVKPWLPEAIAGKINF